MEGLTYKRATFDDYDDYYKIKSDPDNIYWSGFAEKPNYDNFKEVFRQSLQRNDRFIYLVYLNNVACAFFSIDRLSDEYYEFSSSGVLKKYTGLGIGTWLVKIRISLTQQYGAKRVSSWIADDNPQSWRRYQKLGFYKTDFSEERFIVRAGEFKTFHKWILSLNY